VAREGALMAILTRENKQVVVAAAKTQAMTLGSGVAALWGSFAANLVLGGSLLQYGIVPRSLDGLWGIVIAPFLHGNFAHLLSNTVPFLILGWLIMLRNRKHLLPVTLAAMLGAGLTAWLLGASGSVHIGASGVIFGYLGFLMLAGLYARTWGSILLSVLVTGLWGGLVFGVLPGQPGISWQAHLGGFIGGVWAAKLLRKK
jgi:membrane associated rhomboid family serine protease